ncbi:hypothetical protein [Hydrogenivirga sp. 128-5-R1-1]|uniref:hypothetical protein n=1 Tax=Hydrogenivirga sp. 128-5-R1-1 TaxID=392423 RepID=UPI00015F1BCD|nr:hypothetical protein [Hydrogenivirga sp. 128-5-R1-1]EDP73638.1 hypothetical protein HG1285_09871 [Hydrogenivirga sp. 128-5-R1-1]
MNWKSGLKEVGKGLINFGVAVLIFLVLQPFVSGKLDLVYIITAVFSYTFFTLMGLFLVSLGGDEDE